MLAFFFFFFFNDTATTEIYTLSLHDALPTWTVPPRPPAVSTRRSARTPCVPEIATRVLSHRRSVFPSPLKSLALTVPEQKLLIHVCSGPSEVPCHFRTVMSLVPAPVLLHTISETPSPSRSAAQAFVDPAH